MAAIVQRERSDKSKNHHLKVGGSGESSNLRLGGWIQTIISMLNSPHFRGEDPIV